ncbi:hypothetical protein J4H86_18975 [Spiractinospora alimapuensis]|uniref:hypothetical protein n=1 Tax=Spiractinospora alimapuensis TaxID=2820884 RepID=UPI001F40D5B7|nr:hypothetical protein [Spiractinospora alimapuensis]QVQ50925.1 hypothetical protein J4H86_18975 [Spiractinospora alimapuensis]
MIEIVCAQQATSGAADLDEEPPWDEFLVWDSDSSQHFAILASLGRRNVRIEGSPGTRKSQTITNMIEEVAAKEM